jgi:hypothetical protein
MKGNEREGGVGDENEVSETVIIIPGIIPSMTSRSMDIKKLYLSTTGFWKRTYTYSTRKFKAEHRENRLASVSANEVTFAKS